MDSIRSERPFIERSKLTQAFVWAGLVVMCMVATVVLYRFDPAQTRYYPPCMFRALTGLNCPGCGGLRALHKLLHGDIAGAVHSNALVVVFAPVVLWILWRSMRCKASPAQLNSSVPIPLLWLLLGIMIVFGVLRNLPLGQLLGLSP